MKTKLLFMIIALFAATGIMADNYHKWVDGKPTEGLLKNFQFDPITLTLTAELPDAPNGIMFKYDLYWRTNNTRVTHIKDVMDDDHPNSVDYECWGYQSIYSSTDNYRFDIWKSYSASSKNIEGKPGTKQVSFRLMHDQLQQIYKERRKDLFVAMGMFLSSSGMSGDEVKYGESSNMRSWVHIPYHDFWLPDHDEYRENSICFTNAYEFSVPHAMTTAAIVATKSGGEWAHYYNGKRNGYVSPNMTEFSFYKSDEVVTINDSLWYSMAPTVRFNWEYRLDDGEWQTYTGETGMPLSRTEPAIGSSRSLSISPNTKAKYKEEWRAAVTTSNGSYKGEVAYSNVVTLYHKFKADDWASCRMSNIIANGRSAGLGTKDNPIRLKGGQDEELKFMVYAKGNSSAFVRLQYRTLPYDKEEYSDWALVSGSSQYFNKEFNTGSYYITTKESGFKRMQYRYIVESRNGGPTIVSDTAYVDLTKTITLTGPCDYKTDLDDNWREAGYDTDVQFEAMWFDNLLVRPYKNRSIFSARIDKVYSKDEDGNYKMGIRYFSGDNMLSYYPSGNFVVKDDRGNTLMNESIIYGISLRDQGVKMPSAPEKKQAFLGWLAMYDNPVVLSTERVDTMIIRSRDNFKNPEFVAVYAPKKQGDVNNDNLVNATDVVSDYNYMIATPKDITKDDADVNEDGVVNSTDVVTIYNRIEDGLRAGAPQEVIAVDLALPSKTMWANFNLGAHSAEQTGYYVAWGEIMPKKTFSKANYGLMETVMDYDYYERYQRADMLGEYSDNYNDFFPTDDAAFINWGSRWETPTAEQVMELVNPEYTTMIWTEYKGVKGVSIISKENENSIFIPATGYMDGDKTLSPTTVNLWSSTLGNFSYEGIRFTFSNWNNKTTASFGGNQRYQGCNIRPVYRRKTAEEQNATK